MSRLRERRIDLEARSGEGADEHQVRMETALMAVFRESGAAEDFEALHDQARGPLLVWILALTSGRRRTVDPLEVLQDTFVNVYRYARSFRDAEPRSFRVWSRTIAGNLVRRARWVQRRTLQDLPEGLQEPADSRSGPAQELSDSEERRSLARAWMILLARYVAAYERLSPRDRHALELVEVQGLPYAEAGRRLCVGLSNLKMILFRARRRIRAAIARELSCAGSGTYHHNRSRLPADGMPCRRLCG